MFDKSGITLIVLIIIIVIISIVTLGIVAFISNGIELNLARSSMEGAVFAAQAGIYSVIYDYISDQTLPYWSKRSSTQLYGNTYYSVGKDSNCLLVSAANSQKITATLREIPLANVSDAQSITINKMKVEWSSRDNQFNTGYLNAIWLGGVQRWTGSQPSGSAITLTSPFTLTATQSYFGRDDNRWIFSRTIPTSAIIIVTFIFDSDNSSRKAILFGAGKKNEFSITSTGEVRGTTNWKRTIEAAYDAGSGRITSWQETEGHI